MVTVILDEVSFTGAAAGIILGFVMGTWYAVSPDLAFRGLFFTGMIIAGLVFALASRPVISLLLTNLRQALITLILIVLGVAVTAVVQTLILQSGGFPYLSTVSPEMQRVYLIEAAIAETFFYFGLQAFVATHFHPLVGVPVPPAISYFMHQFIYGAMPVLVWVVVGSFAVQSLFFLLTNRLTVPLGQHTVVNFA